MARPTTASTKEPGRLKQMWQVFQMTRRFDGTIVLYLLLAFLAPVGAGIVLAVIFGAGNPVLWILYIVAGVLAGVLLTLIVLGRRAEKAAFSQIEGQAGAVGAVLKSSLRRSWTGNEIPINFNKTQDAVYRAVGKGGVVLIGEGPRTRTQPMLDKKPEVVQRFVDASIEGWYNYLYGDNKAANDLIKKDNPEMTDGQIAYSIAKMKEYGIVVSGDAETKGIGCITDERYKKFFDSMVAINVQPADLDYKKAYSTKFVCKGVGMALKK